MSAKEPELERRIDVHDGIRWVILLAAALLVLGLMAYARGPEHHRGDDVGALRAHVPGATA